MEKFISAPDARGNVLTFEPSEDGKSVKVTIETSGGRYGGKPMNLGMSVTLDGLDLYTAGTFLGTWGDR